MRRMLAGWVVLGLVLAVPLPAAEPESSLLKMLPDGAVAAAEVNGLGARVKQLRLSGFPRWLVDQQRDSGQARQAEELSRGLSAALGDSAWEKLETLLSDRFVAAAYPPSEQKPGMPRAAVIAEVRNEAALREVLLRASALLIATEDLSKSRKQAGGYNRIWLKNGFRLAFGARHIVAATDTRLLDDVLARLTAKVPPGGSLADGKLLSEAARTCGATRPLMGLYAFPKQAAAAYQQPLQIPNQSDNALASLLFGDLLLAASSSSFAAVTVRADESGVDVSLWQRRGAPPSAAVAAAFPETVRVTAPLKPARGTLFSFSMHRDWSAWYRQRETVMQASVLPEFDKFEAAIGNLVPGRDFAKDILPLFGPELSLVVMTPPAASKTDKPSGLALPGMAVVVELAQPQKADDMMRLLFQTIVAILNFEAGQQGTQPWVLSHETYREIEMIYGRPLSSEADAGNAVLAALRPAAARVGSRFMFCSSRDACRRLIDQHLDSAGKSRAVASGTRTSLSVPAALEALERNRGPVIAGAVRDGRTLPEAQAYLAELVEWLARIKGMSLTSGFQSDVGHVSWSWRWK